MQNKSGSVALGVVTGTQNLIAGANILAEGDIVVAGGAPVLSAGQVSLSTTIPTIGANNEGGVFIGSTNGLQLIGQGSANDVTVKNKNNAIALEVPTGTQNIQTPGALIASGSGPTLSAGQVSVSATVPTIALANEGGLFVDATNGASLIGKGGSFDATLQDSAGAVALGVITGTQNIQTGGNVLSSGAIISSGSGISLSSGQVSMSGTTPTIGANNEGGIYVGPSSGLQLIGQGSSFDVTLRNNSGTAALEIPTGTQNVQTPGGLIASGTGPTLSAGQASVSGTAPTLGANNEGGLFVDATNGASLIGQGGSFDATLQNKSGAVALGVVTGTQNLTAGANVLVSGAAISTGSGTTLFAGQVSMSATAPTVGANNEGGLFVSATNGASLIGQGSTYDVSIKNNANSLALGIPTGTQNVRTLGAFISSGGGPTLSAGQVSLSNGAPTIGANSEGGVYSTSANGLSLIGQGSVYDVVLLDNAGSIALGVQTGTQIVYIPKVLLMGASIQAAAGTSALAPLYFSSGTNLTAAAAGAMEYDGAVPYFDVAANQRGVMATESFINPTATYTLTSQTAAQALFNVVTNGTITLPLGTYQFECMFALASMSGSSGSFGFALGGTAVIGSRYHTIASMPASILNTATATYQTWASGASPTTSLTANSTNGNGVAFIKGIVRVTTAGTLIPQVSLTSAAAAVVQLDSYFKIAPLGSQTVTSVGNWS